MGEGGRPTVTREHRKLIIENAGSAQVFLLMKRQGVMITLVQGVMITLVFQGSANSSVERSREKLEKHEKEKHERPGRRKR